MHHTPTVTGIVEAALHVREVARSMDFYQDLFGFEAETTINRKDFEVYGERGLAIATGGSSLRVRMGTESERAVTPDPRAADERDSLSHLIAVVRGARKPNALSSLENNLIVTEILESARESIRSGKTITLK